MPSIEKHIHVCDSKEEAIQLVKEFWDAMPHGEFHGIRNLDDDEYVAELTAGDRTSIIDGRRIRKKGKWVVNFRGNHQPLNKEAVKWLRGKGLLEEDE